MATIVNNPPVAESGNSTSTIVAILLLVVLGFALIFYGIPYFASMTRVAAPTVAVPDKVDVNVHDSGSK